MKHTLLVLGLISSLLIAAESTVPEARPYDVGKYTLSFEMDPRKEPKTLDLEVMIEGKATQTTDALVFDREQIEVHKVSYDSKPAKFETTDPKTIKVLTPRTLKAGMQWRVNIQYTATIQKGHYGFFSVTDPDAPERGNMYFSHFEPQGARMLFPCNDNPSDKAETRVNGTVPVDYEVLSNGASQTQKFKKGKETWKTVTWKMTRPHTTYLVALAIGKFSKITSKKTGTPITVWSSQAKLKKAGYAMEVTEKSLQFFEKYLGVKYPWPLYNTVGLPTFIWGGMENTASTHMNQDRMLLNDPSSAQEKKGITGLVSHELAHQWFGDYVTMKGWEDVWLNESFASIMDTMTSSHLLGTEGPELSFVTDTWADYFRAEDGPRSHPIVDKNLKSPEDAFDEVNYTKGENVLRMLKFYLGEDRFRAGLKNYLKTYGYKNANYQDFVTEMEKASKVNLAKFRDSWLLKRGYPLLTYSGTWDRNNKKYTLTLNQKPNHPEDGTVYDFRLPVVFHRKENPKYDVAVTVPVDQTSVSQTVELAAEPDWVSVNSESIVLAKVTPEKEDRTAIVAQAFYDPKPLDRVWAAYQIIDPLTKGEKLSGNSEETLVTILSNDPSPAVRTSLLTALQRMKGEEIPEKLKTTLLEQASSILNGTYRIKDYSTDLLGWDEWKASVIGALGKIKSDSLVSLLEPSLLSSQTPLDILGNAATALAKSGNDRASEILNAAAKTQAARGYRFRYVVERAFASFENVKAASEIRKLTERGTPDLIGKMGWALKDNQVLKNSSEWRDFLKTFVLENTRFDDEVKYRLLQSVEDIKTSDVKDLFQTLKEKSSSERIRRFAETVLSKS